MSLDPPVVQACVRTAHSLAKPTKQLHLGTCSYVTQPKLSVQPLFTENGVYGCKFYYFIREYLHTCVRYFQ